ncbi:MAG: tetratricopeptide repeat protein [Planctomycetota bacterium]|nr:tetratricopeptide repeat protein [Planctomycetota bacterium]
MSGFSRRGEKSKKLLAIILFAVSLASVSCASTSEELQKKDATSKVDKVFKYLEKRVEESNALYEQGDYERAAEAREELLEEYPAHPYIDNGEFFARIGDCWRKAEKNENALKWYHKAIERFTRDMEVFRNKIKESNVPDEWRMYADIIENNLLPRLASVHTHTGEIYLKEQQYNKSLLSFFNALSANSGHLRAFYLLGCTYEKLEGQEKNALKTFGELLQLLKMASAEDVKRYGLTERDIEYVNRRVKQLSEKVFQ